jgi:hypothetical protein
MAAMSNAQANVLAFHHAGLVCSIQGIALPTDDTLRVFVAPGNYPDMSGAINFATSIAEHLAGFELRRIEFIDNGKATSVYAIADDGDWACLTW